MLIGTYNYYLVLASYVVASIASYVALDMAGRVTSSRGLAARWWLICGGGAMGFGIWSMHFLGMLAFQLPIPLGYALGKTVLSLIIAMIASGFALWMAAQSELPPRRLAVGAILMGGGIAAMHYTGMAAMEIVPGIVYDPIWFLLSIVIAIAAAGAAMWIAFHLRQESRHSWKRRSVAAMVMGFAVVGMHYTGMAAAGFPEGSFCGAAGPDGIQAEWLAVLIGIAAFAVLAIALIVSVLDRRLEERTSLLADSLERANHELSYLALHDNLTKLPNRMLLEDRLEQAIQKHARSNTRFALMFLDLDGFKAVNDIYGHQTGDSLLHAVAARIVGSIRAQDTVARIGGDEFVVLAAIAEPDDAAEIAQALVQALHRDFSINRNDVRISASIGIAIFPHDGAIARELMINADAAMYYAKEHGRNGFRFFEPSMNEGVKEQLALVQDLRHAVERGELFLQYQPKFRAPDGPVIGAEALVRWQHPERGLIPPDRFIPLAEKGGVIFDIGRWVLEEACRQLRAWQDAGQTNLSVSVNLSPMQFGSHGLYDLVRNTLEAHGVPPRCLMLEITETTAMQDPEHSLGILQRLDALGVSISIDDFGTGYSSLMYLKRLPARELKIDRGFVRDLASGSEDAAIVSAIIALGKTLNLHVIAEGVETSDQAGLLTHLGCDSLQGFLLGTPAEPAEFIRVVNARGVVER